MNYNKVVTILFSKGTDKPNTFRQFTKCFPIKPLLIIPIIT